MNSKDQKTIDYMTCTSCINFILKNIHGHNYCLKNKCVQCVTEKTGYDCEHYTNSNIFAYLLIQIQYASKENLQDFINKICNKYKISYNEFMTIGEKYYPNFIVDIDVLNMSKYITVEDLEEFYENIIPMIRKI